MSVFNGIELYKSKINELVNLANMHDISKSKVTIELLLEGLVKIQKEGFIHSLSNFDKNYLYNSEKENLNKIATVLKSHSSLKIKKIQSIIFGTLEPMCFYVTNNKKILDHIANTFSEFVKGITYFATNTKVSLPIYHREQSCGNKSELDQLDCTGVYHDPDEYSRRSAKVRKCYIDRLVYDELFQHYFPSGEQDYNHKAMLMDTARGKNKFASCFPNTVLSIKLYWTDDKLFPYKLEIYSVSPSKETVETYIRELKKYSKIYHNVDKIETLISDKSDVYKNIVTCNKTIYDYETNMLIKTMKTQDFSGNKQWNDVFSSSIRK